MGQVPRSHARCCKPPWQHQHAHPGASRSARAPVRRGPVRPRNRRMRRVCRLWSSSTYSSRPSSSSPPPSSSLATRDQDELVVVYSVRTRAYIYLHGAFDSTSLGLRYRYTATPSWHVVIREGEDTTASSTSRAGRDTQDIQTDDGTQSETRHDTTDGREQDCERRAGTKLCTEKRTGIRVGGKPEHSQKKPGQ